MSPMTHRRLFAAAGLSAALSAGAAAAVEEITVAYFLEWPTPNQYAQAQGLYDEALGVRVNWRAFETGVQMSAAMASGAVQILYSQGVPPFVIASSAGLPIELVGVAVTYDDNDNCVVHASQGVTAANATDLEGKRVAVPLGTAAHYGFLKQMEHFGVDVSTLSVVDMPPADGAAALARGDLAMACGWGGGLRRMKEHGNVLLTGAEKRELGIRIFDVVSVDSNFAAANPELIAGFLRVTEDMNRRFESEREAMLPVISQASGMDLDATDETLNGFGFPDMETQLSDAWMGGGLQAFLKEVADFFAEHGNVESPLDSYDGVVNATFMQKAAEM
ncbi:MAG: taurine ABC transporter substrate-binding protein [Rhodobacteraceae bacterium]|nr:MAG: taurine ABC transporter substrate-binding protein [Paracoccaceae bacterium]